MQTVIRRQVLAAAAALACGVTAVGWLPAAQAATPKDMLVMAGTLDEFSTLDPAEVYELVPMEYLANTYDRLIRANLSKPGEFDGDAAESWSVSEDGKTFTFKIRQGQKFHSGNPVTAEDVAWSLQRTPLLGKGAAVVLAGIGLTKDNALQNVKLVDAGTVSVTTDRKFAPTFVLSILGSWPASIVDKKLLTEKAQGSDMGNGWLKTNEAGSGIFKLNKWTANQTLTLDRFDGHRSPAAMKRVVLRHVPEASGRRLLLEKGDVDIARELSPDDMVALEKTGKVKLQPVPQAVVYYMGMNQKNPNLAKPEVREAMRYAVDYDGIQKNIVKSLYNVHQTFLPPNMLGAWKNNPYKQDVAKAKALLAKAGLPDGFAVTMEVRNTYPYNEVAQAVQADLAKVGIKLTLNIADNKQTLAKYRARTHDIYMGEWSADYLDPHSNAQGFAWNPDNSDASPYKMLSWRNAWDIPDFTKRTDEALAEQDTAKRAALYQAMQKDFQPVSPYVVMFNKVSQVAMQSNVKDFTVGPIYDLVQYRSVKKN